MQLAKIARNVDLEQVAKTGHVFVHVFLDSDPLFCSASRDNVPQLVFDINCILPLSVRLPAVTEATATGWGRRVYA